MRSPLSLESAVASIANRCARTHRQGLGPGLAVVLTHRSGWCEVMAHGTANVVTGQPVTEDTVFQIGSVSKVVTAAALLRLVEMRSIDLSAPVTDYLDWFEVRSEYEPITLHHLLTHTAGLVSLIDTVSASEHAVWQLRDTETGFAPGTRFHYSNMGYLVLGLVLAAVTGHSYADTVATLVFEPLGMSASSGASPGHCRPPLACGHERRDGAAMPVLPASITGGHAGVVSTPTDLSVLLRMLLDEGGGYLATSSALCMTRGSVTTDWPCYDYGYGLFSGRIETLGGHRIIQHGGENPGFESVMIGDLDTGFGLGVFVNSYEQPWELAQKALRILQAVDPQGLSSDPPHGANRDQSDSRCPPPPEQSRHPLAGRYRAHATLLTDFAVLEDGMALVLESGDGYRQPLTHLEGHTYTIGDPPTPERLTFGPFVDSRVLACAIGGGTYSRVESE